jgi:hypothetical protein
MSSSQPERPVIGDHLSEYVTYQPTPYDAGITADPDLRWDDVQGEPEAEACP